MKVAILGTGAYGLSLGMKVVENTKDLILYTPIDTEYQMLKETYQSTFLKGVTLDRHMTFTTSLRQAIDQADIILITTPTQYLPSLFAEMKNDVKPNQILLLGSKGLLDTTPPWIHVNMQLLFPNNAYGILSGPTFAKDVVTSLPIRLTLTTDSKYVQECVKKAFQTSSLTIENHTDYLGVELCGALKNIFAIGSGILAGLSASESTMAFYFYHAVMETKTLLKQMGASESTIFTAAGIGDMYLTMSSKSSRNYSYGWTLGSKASAKEITTYEIEHTVEGRNGLQQLLPLLSESKIENELISVLYQIVYEKKDPEILLNYLSK